MFETNASEVAEASAFKIGATEIVWRSFGLVPASPQEDSGTMTPDEVVGIVDI
jgi:hypothetical protein